jgi:hypothetical protein
MLASFTTLNAIVKLFYYRRNECKPFVSLTGTFKMKKLDLQRDGIDPEQIKDKLYYLNKSEAYECLTEEIYNQILSGKIRL